MLRLARRLFHCLALAPVLLVPFAIATKAATLEVESRIESVTVQLDRAQVVRRAILQLTAGEHELIFPDLPASADRASVHLEAQGSSVVLGQAVFREVETLAPVGATARRLNTALERLEQERRVERDAIALQTLLLDVLRRSQLSFVPGESARMAEPGSLLGLIETRGQEALMAIREAEQVIARLDAEIDRTQRQIDGLGESPMRQLTTTVPISVSTEGEVAVSLSYAVGRAGFVPSIEANLDIDAGTVTLTAVAEVSQQTGEDWENVELALSTATINWSTSAPPTETWYVDVHRDEPRPANRLHSGAPAALADNARIVLDQSPFDVVYRLAEPATIRADGSAQRVTIVSLELPADLVWRTVPAFDDNAYLTAAMTYTGDRPLLPGVVYLRRDGQAVGETSLGGLRPNEQIELGFGVDPQVQVERKLITDERAQSGLIGTTQRHERQFVLKATNHRTGPIALEMIDQLPVSRDARITVELLAASSPPSTIEHGGEQGVLAWQQRVEPGETAAVTFAYALRHPADLEVSGF